MYIFVPHKNLGIVYKTRWSKSLKPDFQLQTLSLSTAHHMYLSLFFVFLVFFPFFLVLQSLAMALFGKLLSLLQSTDTRYRYSIEKRGGGGEGERKEMLIREKWLKDFR